MLDTTGTTLEDEIGSMFHYPTPGHFPFHSATPTPQNIPHPNIATKIFMSIG